MPMSSPAFSSHVQIEDRRLHYRAAGDGPVTVLFEAGMGKSRSTWSLVQPEVAKFARTVVYDRAGLGLSDVRPDGRGFSNLLEDHLAILDQTTWTGPVVSVGHSYGGPIARAAAMLRPKLVAGVVTVDEVSEVVEPAQMMAAMRGASVMYGGQVLFARLGLLRPLLRRSFYRTLSGEDLRLALAESTVSAMKTAREEWRAFGLSFEVMHDTGPFVPEVPLTVISSNRQAGEKDFLGLGQRALAEMSPAGRQVYAEGRDHYIQFTEPELVIREIRQMVETIA